MDNSAFNKVDKWIIFFFVVLVVPLAVSLILYVTRFNEGLSLLHSNWGEFGDFFGGIVGSLISLFAVILLYFTYRLQRVELAKSTEALNNQNEQLNIQQFENIVFKLLDRKDEVLNNLSFKKRPGIEAIKHLNKELVKMKIEHKYDDGYNEMVALNKWWSSYKSYMIPLFNSVVSAINFIETYQVNDVIRYRLVQIYFNNFSLEEIEMLNNIFKMYVGNESYKSARIFFNNNTASIVSKL